MSLTLSDGPLAASPAPTNYTIDGPAHRIFFAPFPRRLRAELAGAVVLDTVRAQLLHESNLLPQVYVPLEDVQGDLLEHTDHRTHCPFKGDATYRSVRVGDRIAENALWAYEDPLPAAPWLSGYVGVYFNRLDRWLDEDEVIDGHLRDPFHRVDARRSSRRVRVLAGEAVLAETSRPIVVSETGLQNRIYVPREDVRAELRRSERTTVCPYKGTATYWSAGPREDVAWTYEEPLEAMEKARGYVSFDGDGVEVLGG